MNETSTSSNNQSDLGRKNLPNDEFTVESEAGAIAGIIFGLAIFAVMVVFAVIMIKRKRYSDKDYRKQLRMQKSIKESAGVYMDTTTEDLMVQPTEGGIQSESDDDL